MNMVLDDYDGKIIPRAEFRLNFLTFVEERPRKKPQTRNWPDRSSNHGPLGDMRQRWFYVRIDLNMKKYSTGTYKFLFMSKGSKS